MRTEKQLRFWLYLLLLSKIAVVVLLVWFGFVLGKAIGEKGLKNIGLEIWNGTETKEAK